MTRAQRLLAASAVAIAGSGALVPASGAAGGTQHVYYAAPVAKSAGCTKSAPCGIGTAFSKATGTATIILAAGSYGSPSTPLTQEFTTTSKQLTIRGARSGHTRIYSSASGSALLVDAGSTASDLSIDYIVPPPAGYALTVLGSANRIFVRSTVNACAVSSGTLANSVCWSTNSGTSGAIHSFPSNGQAVHIVGVDAIAQGGCGLYVFEPSNGSAQVTVKNSIMSANSCGVGAGGGGGPGTVTVSVDHSSYTAAAAQDASATVTTNSTDITDPPQFADLAHGNFAEVVGGPTVDAGRTSANVGSTDLAGHPRTQGRAVDMGAYEAISGPTVGKLKVLKRTTHSIEMSVNVNPDGFLTTARLIASRPTYDIVLHPHKVGSGHANKRVLLTVQDLPRHTKYILSVAATNAAGTHTSKKVTATTR